MVVFCYAEIIVGNITIGDNVIIGANAVVTKDVPTIIILLVSPQNKSKERLIWQK